MTNGTAKKYGNDHYWAFIEDGWSIKEVAIWQGNKNGGPRILARANDKYDAKQIIDALLNYNNVASNISLLEKKEIAFLEFVQANCIEPYSTMASNAIMWNDRLTYNKLKSDFPVIYS